MMRSLGCALEAAVKLRKRVAGFNSWRMMLAYLDQNVLGLIREEHYRLADAEVLWLYSTQHLNEISRGEDMSYLSVLACPGY
jgi:hypothetical protein